MKQNETITTDYLSGFQYKMTVLQFFQHAEGYVNVTRMKGGVMKFDYVFNYTDHLGNIRLSYAWNNDTSSLKILEENHYYPFGLKHTNYNANKYRFDEFKKEEAQAATTPQTEEELIALKIKQENPLDKPLPTTKLSLTSVNASYNYKFQSQERQDELGLNWDSFKWRNYDYAIGRFMCVDPLATDFPQWSPYVFSGNLVTMTRELEGMEPSYLIGADGKLTQGAITVMNSAFGYTPKSLTNTTWISDNDPRANIIQTSLIPNKSVAVTWRNSVAYDHNASKKPSYWWLGTIAHEQRHRSDIDAFGGREFYKMYASEGIMEFGNPDNMLIEQAGYTNDKYGTQLWNYNNGEVARIFQNGGVTENQRSQMLESAGSRFKRDVILNDLISNNSSLINKTTDIINGLGNSTSDKSMKLTLSSLISSWQQSINNAKKEQTNITNTYGK